MVETPPRQIKSVAASPGSRRQPRFLQYARMAGFGDETWLCGVGGRGQPTPMLAHRLPKAVFTKLAHPHDAAGSPNVNFPFCDTA
jgi:hypothetical protein